jgi:hypothetical protein
VQLRGQAGSVGTLELLELARHPLDGYSSSINAAATSCGLTPLSMRSLG